jgi:hypothetical protein
MNIDNTSDEVDSAPPGGWDDRNKASYAIQDDDGDLEWEDVLPRRFVNLISLQSIYHCMCHRRQDYHTRADRVQNQVDCWQEQIPSLARAYLGWQAGNVLQYSESEKPWSLVVHSFEGAVSLG